MSLLSKLKESFKVSNRYKHFIYAIPVGTLFTFLCVLGLASGMEFKDWQWGGKWDWEDWGWTLVGGSLGQVLQVIILCCLSII